LFKSVLRKNGSSYIGSELAKKALTSSSKSTNHLLVKLKIIWIQAWAKFKPPKVSEISVGKMTTRNTKKMTFLLPDKKHESSLTY